MRSVATFVFCAAVLLPVAASADVIVMQDGSIYEIEGPIRVQGDLILFTLSTGQAVSFRRFEVDEQKTLAMNQLLASEVEGLPRLRGMEAIEARRSRTHGRSIPIQEALPEPVEEDIRDMAGQRISKPYPQGDYPAAVQPERVARQPIGRDVAQEIYESQPPTERRPLMTDEIMRQREQERARAEAEREARREARRQERAARRAERRAAREAEEAAERAAREAEMQRMQRTREPEPMRPEPEMRQPEPARDTSRLEARADRYQERIEEVDADIRSTQADLQRLTDLQREAQEEFEGARLRSVDREIDRNMKKLERLQERRQDLQERLDEVEAEMGER